MLINGTSLPARCHAEPSKMPGEADDVVLEALRPAPFFGRLGFSRQSGWRFLDE
jgi:hypothetical protein